MGWLASESRRRMVRGAERLLAASGEMSGSFAKAQNPVPNDKRTDAIENFIST